MNHSYNTFTYSWQGSSIAELVVDYKFEGNSESTIEGQVVLNTLEQSDLGNAKLDGKFKELAEFMTSFCQGKPFVLCKDFEKYEMEPEDEDSDMIWLLHNFTMAIKNSFHNGHAREYLHFLFCTLEVGERYFFEAQRKSHIDGFYLEIIQKKKLRSKRPAPLSLTTRSAAKRSTSGSTTSDKNGSDTSKRFSSDSGPNKHHEKGVRRPDFVVVRKPKKTRRTGKCTIVFEVKSNCSKSAISEGISQLLSYGLSIRSKPSKRNSTNEAEMALILITPIHWIVSRLPPSTAEIQHPLEFRTINIFAKSGGQLCFQLNGYLKFLNFLNEFIY